MPDKRGNRPIVRGSGDGKLTSMPTHRRRERYILITGGQFGSEVQGWGLPLTIHGDSRQASGVPLVEDLADAFLLAQEQMRNLSGQLFNIGGGPSNTTSLLELMNTIGELHGHAPEIRFADWRTADQQYYVSDTRRRAEAAEWPRP